jgi:hypothetical protein
MNDSKSKSSFCRAATGSIAQCALLLIACSSGGSNATMGATGGTTGTMTTGGTTGVAGAGTMANAGTASGGTVGTGGSSGTSHGGSLATGGGGSPGAGGNSGGSTAGGGGGNGGTSVGGAAAGTGGVNASGGTGGANGGSGGASNGGAGGAAAFALTSSAFMEGEQIPLMYKCAEVPPVGQNISPPLSWGPGPAGTMSYAIILMHVPSPEHWVIWDIPADVTALPENIDHQPAPSMPAGSKQSTITVPLDGFTGPGYLGPCPQAHNMAQTYQFTLYALDVATLPGLTATSTPAEAAAVVKAHLVAGSQGVSLSGTQIQTP